MESTNQVGCPTCRAVQQWSDTCRRCRSDLRLLRTFDEQYRGHRASAVTELRARHFQSALNHAYCCVQLRPDEQSYSLLAICALIGGDWESAVKIGEEWRRRKVSGERCQFSAKTPDT